MNRDRPEPRWGCHFLEGGLTFLRDSLHACCVGFEGGGFPHLAPFTGGDIPLDAALQSRKEILDKLRRGERTSCTGCRLLTQARWYGGGWPFDLINLGHFTRCNLACTYCYTTRGEPQDPPDPLFDLLPTFRSMIDQGLLSPRALVGWGGGEPTLLSEFEDLLGLLRDHGTHGFVMTNGVILSPSLLGALRDKRANIIVSVDCGDPQVYVVEGNR